MSRMGKVLEDPYKNCFLRSATQLRLGRYSQRREMFVVEGGTVRMCMMEGWRAESKGH